jgi:hypothetical protein
MRLGRARLPQHLGGRRARSFRVILHCANVARRFAAQDATKDWETSR